MTCTQSCFATKYRPYFIPITIGGNQNFKEIHNFLLTRDFEIIARNAKMFRKSRNSYYTAWRQKRLGSDTQSRKKSKPSGFLDFPPFHIKQLLFVKLSPNC